MKATEINPDLLMILQLVSGETIVCQMLDMEKGEMTVNHAAQLIEDPEMFSNDIYFVPWFDVTDDDEPITIFEHAVVARAMPRKDLEESYLSSMAELTAEPDEEEVVVVHPPTLRSTCRNGKFGQQQKEEQIESETEQ